MGTIIQNVQKQQSNAKSFPEDEHCLDLSSRSGLFWNFTIFILQWHLVSAALCNF